MNKEQRQIKKIIDKAYSDLHVLSNITWTPYRDEIFDLNKKDEKQHRFNRPSSDFEATINDFAWNESYSRSIGVDIRYVLWITQKFGGAD